MAKLKYLRNIMEESSAFEGDFDLAVKSNGKQATWTVVETEATITLEGKGLTASEENGDWLGGGKISDVTVKNGEGKTILDISDLDIKATKLTALFEAGGVGAALLFITEGNDKVTGTNNSDYLFSGAGNDVLTGKGGSDTFQFQAFEEVERAAAKGEYDIITDFDTKGLDADILSVEQEIAGFKGVNKGHDTLVRFEDGSKLLLEHVKAAQFDKYLDSFME